MKVELKKMINNLFISRITNQIVALFSIFYNIKLPVYDPNNIKYYIELLDQYYNTKNLWKYFTDDIKSCNGIENFKKFYIKLTNDITSVIRSHQEFIDLQLLENNEQNVSPYFYRNISNICDSRNNNYICIKYKMSDFGCLKTNCPTLFDCDTWEEWISKFTDKQSIIHSRLIRKAIFNRICDKNIENYGLHFLINVMNYVSQTEYGNSLEIIHYTKNKIYFRIINNNYFNIEEFKKMIDEQFNNLFAINKFTLQRIVYSESCIKTIDDTKIKIKNILPQYIAQAIKFVKYGRSNNLESLDLVVDTGNGHIAVYNKPFYEIFNYSQVSTKL